MSQRLYRHIFLFGLIVSALGLFLASEEGHQAFARGNHAPINTYSVSPTTNSSVADTTYTLVQGDDTMNFGGVSLATPEAACLSFGVGNPNAQPACLAATPPALGDVAGTLTSSVFISVTNAPCST
ncbi:MAG: hypothetical protein ACREUU_09700, partial [Gammaproteobacteria bacterium]